MFSEKTAGETFCLESSLTFRSLILDTSLSRAEPGINKQITWKNKLIFFNTFLMTAFQCHPHHTTEVKCGWLTGCVVLCDSERIQSCSKSWTVGENANPLTCYLCRGVSAAQRKQWLSLHTTLTLCSFAINCSTKLLLFEDLTNNLKLQLVAGYAKIISKFKLLKLFALIQVLGKY